MNRIGLAAALVLGVGCNASVNGTIGGEPVSAPDSTYRTETIDTIFFGKITTTTVILGGQNGDLCDDLANGVERAGTSSLILSFNGGVTKGEWVIGGPSDQGKVTAHVSRLDTKCASLLAQTAGSGKVTVTSIDGNVQGSFDLGFGADRLTGSFNAQNCASPFIASKNCL